MKKLFKQTLSVLTAISLIGTINFTVIADEDDVELEYNLVEYDYVNKTEHIISADEIFDYSATTTTTYELDSMAAYVAAMEQTASTYKIVDTSATYMVTAPVDSNNRYVDPYSGVMCLMIGVDNDQDGITDVLYDSRGTGFMVSDDVMVTAAHCVMSKNQTETVSSIRIYSGWHKTIFPTQYVYDYIYPERWVVSTAFVDRYQSSGDWTEYDWCVMKLQDSIPDVYNFACAYEMVTGESVAASGYPNCINLSCGNTECGHAHGFMVTSWGTVSNLYNKKFYLTNNIKKGHSGGPIYISAVNGSYICCGIISAEPTEDNSYYNIGTRITRDVYNIIAEYIGQ